MSDSQNDRRKTRSENQDEAVKLQLAHVAEVLDLEALVLADDFGQQLAGVGEAEVGELLSALAMWVDFNGGQVDELTLETLQARDPEMEPHHVVVQPVSVPGNDARLQLIALGRSLMTSIGLSHAAEGIERIHRTTPS